MEFKVYVDGIERVISGVTLNTTCRDIVLCLAQATQQFGKFVLIEKWRQNERLLAPNELPIQLLNRWGDLSNEVCFIMRRSDLHQQIQQQLQQHQQQQFINNEPLYSTVQRPSVYNANNVLHPINQMNQLNQLNQLNNQQQINSQLVNQMNNQLNQQMNPPINAHQLNSQINLQPIYHQQANQLQSNNLIFKQNLMKPNYSNSQQTDYTNQPIYTTKFTTQLPQQQQLNLNLNSQLNQQIQQTQLNNQINQQFIGQKQQMLGALQVQANQNQNKQMINLHQHSPHNLQSSPLNQLNQIYGQIQRPINMQSTQHPQYSPNVLKLNQLNNQNLIGNQMMNNQINQISNLNQLNQINQQISQQQLNQQINNQQQMNQLGLQSQYVCRQDLITSESVKNNRPKCPPSYNEALAKSILLHNSSPVNTSHSPSIYQQQDLSSQARYSSSNANTIKLNSVISNPNLQQVVASRSSSTPSPITRSAISQPNLKPETYYHVSVQQLKSKFDANANDQKPNSNFNLNVVNKTLDKKNFESSFLQEKENRTALKQLNKKDSKESSNKQTNLSSDNRDYQINNYQTEQLEALQKDMERIEQEKNQIANNINETDLKIAKCRQKIQFLMDEIKDVSTEKENEKQKVEEDITLSQINEIKHKIEQSIKEYESSSEKLNKLQNELDKLESTLNERKKMIEELTTDIKEANIEGLTLMPLEDQNGNILENENRPPMNDNCESNGSESRFNVRLGSTRKCLKITNDGELHHRNSNGVWV